MLRIVRLEWMWLVHPLRSFYADFNGIPVNHSVKWTNYALTVKIQWLLKFESVKLLQCCYANITTFFDR